MVRASGRTAAACRVSDLRGMPCQRQADVKLADSGGHAARACVAHADEILMMVPGAFIAGQYQGIAGFLSRRRG